MSEAAPKLIALIPARQGSKRVTGKNIRPLHGHPLIAYTIAAALDSGVCDRVMVSTDTEDIARIARHYGADVPFLRPEAMAADRSPDIEWLEFTIDQLAERGVTFDCFALLRPTSPFRTSDTIRRAWQSFLADRAVDSLRAVEKCHEHPGKMWVIRGRRLLPIMPFGPPSQPWHSTPYQALPEIYVQNASLEIAWTRVVRDTRSIAGETILPFVTEDTEGFDINNEQDWVIAEHLLASGAATLPVVRHPAYLPH
jgi:N-acylneuraminate cytidylyltransferase